MAQKNYQQPGYMSGSYDAGLTFIGCPTHGVPLRLVGSSSYPWLCPVGGEQWDDGVNHIGPMPAGLVQFVSTFPYAETRVDLSTLPT